ncbi:hypothetical protein [Hahella ganghwensis]|uniref:hypothetical protein n=1 Tax=Hahella ganghwensis TaxID=286420 RepID=UPI000365AA2E|nr:hypothetical protein [Hahella ganghwensis]
MTDKIEETIKEIAAKHGIAVGRDDPILILQTINERLMKDSASAQEEILARYKSELEEISHRWGEDAKSKAERTLNAALSAGREAMTKTMQESAALTASGMRKEMESVIENLLRTPIKEARTVAKMNIIAACMTVFAAGLALWSTL